MAEAGSELHEDYDTVVLEAGLNAEYKLTQTTFEAAADADHGAQILYDLATDKALADKVYAMTPFQQLKYVAEQDAAISTKRKPRVVPKAGRPAPTTPRGNNSSRGIRADTDNLDDFEKEFEKGFK